MTREKSRAVEMCEAVARYAGAEFAKFAAWQGHDVEIGAALACDPIVVQACDIAAHEIAKILPVSRSFSAMITSEGVDGAIGRVVGECLGTGRSIERVIAGLA